MLLAFPPYPQHHMEAVDMEIGSQKNGRHRSDILDLNCSNSFEYMF